jgi:hypothetical protein
MRFYTVSYTDANIIYILNRLKGCVSKSQYIRQRIYSIIFIQNNMIYGNKNVTHSHISLLISIVQ